jgi:type IV secretory pathway VirB10-like protein
MAKDTRDLYQRFEIQVRTPKKRTFLDAFLPAPESLESTVAPSTPPPLPVPEMTPEEANMFRRREPEDNAPEPAPKARARKKTAPRKKEAPKSLQDEITEFMNRDRPALAPDDDLSSLVDQALDPKTGPDKKG